MNNEFVQGGDTDQRNGNGGHSIYGPSFEDEQIWIPHKYKGLVSTAKNDSNGYMGKLPQNMVNCENFKGFNNSQFIVTFAPMEKFNFINTVFARIIHGWDFFEEINEIETEKLMNKLMKRVIIEDCGELVGDKKLTADKCDSLHIYKTE